MYCDVLFGYAIFRYIRRSARFVYYNFKPGLLMARAGRLCFCCG